MIGRNVTVEEVMEVVLRDRPFYESSGGGLTLSGGEPLLQAAFCKALLQQAKQAGLHTCVETCGQYSYDRLEAVAPYVDLFLYDWKESDAARHLAACGTGNERILANLRALDGDGRKIRLRCPIIPEFNDRPDHFEGIAELARSLHNLEGVELLPYHPLGVSKMRRFGLDHETMPRVRAEAPESLSRWVDFLRQRGVVVV
jgi:pyruvate formate lyase activating enzyme